MRRSWRGWGLAALVVAAAVLVNLRMCSTQDTSRDTPRADPEGAASIATWAHAAAAGAQTATTFAVELGSSGGLRLEGQIVDEHDQPIAGSHVAWSATESSERGTATSEADGSFAIEHLAIAEYRVIARTADQYGDPELVQLTPLTEPVVLKLKPGITVALHVVDGADNSSIANATVAIDDEHPQLTDATGTTELRGIGPLAYVLDVSAPGYATHREYLQPYDEHGTLHESTVPLHRGAPLDGRVLGPNDLPVADARVCIASSPHTCAAKAVSDAKGEFHVSAVAAGDYELTASSKLYGPAAAQKLEADGATARRDVIVHVAVDAQLVGIVVDARGTPVPNAIVSAETVPSSFRPYTVTTDARGRFEMLGRTAGSYLVGARGAAYASERQRITLVDNARVEVRFVLEDVRIAGVVVDQTGAPVVGAKLTAYGTMESTDDLVSDDTTTDLHGRFEMDRLVPGDYRVVTMYPGNARNYDGAARTDRLWAGTTNLRLLLEAPASVVGRALLDGAPMQDYEVRFGVEGNDYGGPRITVHAADGRFALRDVKPGSWNVVVVGSGTAYTRLPLQITPGQAVDLGDVKLVRGPRITGHVRDTARAPVAGATVSLGVDDHGGTYTATTDADGAFAFTGVTLRDGPVQISATHPERGTSLERTLGHGDATVELALLATGGIDGEIEGTVGSNTSVSVWGASDDLGSFGDGVGSDGTFHIDGMPAGDYWLIRYTPAMHAPSPALRVTVATNQRTHVHLTTPSIAVTLRVKVASGLCEVIALFSWPRTPGDWPDDEQCASGVATFVGVAPATYSAAAWLSGAEPTGGTPIVVAPSPAVQTVMIPAAP